MTTSKTNIMDGVFAGNKWMIFEALNELHRTGCKVHLQLTRAQERKFRECLHAYGWVTLAHHAGDHVVGWVQK